MSPTFYGPVAQTRTLVSPDPRAWAQNPAGQRLLAHFGSQPDGVNVFIMTNGTVTRDNPTDWTLVAHALWGAHDEPITDAEATLLTAAGYGAYIT